MNREELKKQIEDNVEALGYGRDDAGWLVYSTGIEDRQINQIITIAEQYAESKVSQLRTENDRLQKTLDFNVKENVNILRQLSEKIAENEKLKEFAKLSKKNIDDWVKACPELYGAEDVEFYEEFDKLNIIEK
jgi:hypothetical protein